MVKIFFVFILFYVAASILDAIEEELRNKH